MNTDDEKSIITNHDDESLLYNVILGKLSHSHENFSLAYP